MDREAIERGLAAYAHERAVLKRLLRRRGEFSERDFDRWFKAPKRRKIKFRQFTGDTLLLGLGYVASATWATNLELLQYMVYLGEAQAETRNGVIIYRAP